MNAVDPVEEFGQRIAADFIIVHKDSRSTETVVLVVRDEATGYMRLAPVLQPIKRCQVQSSRNKVLADEFGLSAKFLANERARNNARRVNGLPGEESSLVGGSKCLD